MYLLPQALNQEHPNVSALLYKSHVDSTRNWNSHGHLSECYKALVFRKTTKLLVSFLYSRNIPILV